MKPNYFSECIKRLDDVEIKVRLDMLRVSNSVPEISNKIQKILDKYNGMTLLLELNKFFIDIGKLNIETPYGVLTNNPAEFLDNLKNAVKENLKDVL
jgi:hypothetical protein